MYIYILFSLEGRLLNAVAPNNKCVGPLALKVHIYISGFSPLEYTQFPRVHTYTHAHKNIHACMHACTQKRTQTNTHTYITYTHAYIHTYIHTRTNIHTYIQTNINK